MYIYSDRSHDRRRQYSRSRSRDRGGQVYKRGGRDSSSEMYPTHMDEEHSHDRYDRRGRDSDRRGGNSRRLVDPPYPAELDGKWY